MARRKTHPNLPSQGWTRCLIPLGTCLPTDLWISIEMMDNPKSYQDQRSREWPKAMLPLTTAPGYCGSSCGRNIDDPEDVLFIACWSGDASLEAFTASPRYTAFQKALGIENSERRWPTMKPSMRDSHVLHEQTGIFTLSFAHPISDEDREMLGYFELPVKIQDGCPSLPNLQYQWIREPQLLEDGQLVEQGVLINRSPDVLDNMVPQIHPRIFRCGANVRYTVSEHERTMGRWQRYIKRVKPLRVEEVIWDTCDEEEDYQYDSEEEARRMAPV